MSALLKKYGTVVSYFLMIICLTFTSTWIKEVLSVPPMISKLLTLALYVPFMFAIGWKIISDLIHLCKKEYRHFDIPTVVFYVFIAYYALISCYRLLNAMEIKENLYYSIVFLGSVAYYLQSHKDCAKVGFKGLSANIGIIVLAIVLYDLAYRSIGSLYISKNPINANLVSGCLTIALPFLCMCYCRKTSTVSMVVYGIAACCSIVIVLITGARALFLLTCLTIVVAFAACLISKQGFGKILILVIVSLSIVLTLALCDVGKVRYSLSRETGLNISALLEEKNTSSSGTQSGKTDKDTGGTKKPGSSANREYNSAMSQVDRSDKMRSDLVNLGLEEVRQHPWIGSGNVTFSYKVSKNYIAEQSSHNFIIETMICYGLIGLVLVATLFITLLIQSGLFRKSSRSAWLYRLCLLQTLVAFFGLGFVQPTVFSPLTCSLFVLILAASRQLLSEYADR